jgi:hypothetical protein
MTYKSFRNMLIVAGLLSFGIAALAKDSKVRIHVNPAEASIFIDGTPFGDSSRTVRIAPGKHTIGVYNYGYKPEVREVTLEPGTNTGLEFKLDPVAGQTSGPWGRIQIEGASRAAVLLNGKTPEFLVGHGDEFNNGGEFFACCTQELIVPVGTHQLTLVNQDKELWSGPVTVEANQRVIVYIPSGRTKIKPWPEGAMVGSLDRFKAGAVSATVAIAPVSGTIAAQPAQINCGDSTQVSWSTAETVQRSITAESETMKEIAPNGEFAVQPKAATTYNLQAAGPGGTVNQSVTVDVNTAIKSSLEASPAEVRYRRIGDRVVEQGSASLSWNVFNASNVSIEPLGSVSAKDTQTVKPAPKQDQNGTVDEVQTYQLTAKNECGGSDTQTASLHIVGSIEPIPEVPLASVFFPTGYPDQRHPELGLVKSQQQRLAKTAEGFKKYLEYDPDAKLTLFANADERDSRARNKRLSERRGNLAKQYLVSLGIPENKIEVVAQGKEKPLDASAVKSLDAQNPTATRKVSNVQVLTWAYNRRVDIGLMPKDVRSSQYFPRDAEDAAVLADSDWPDHKDNIVILAAEKERLPVNPK